MEVVIARIDERLKALTDGVGKISEALERLPDTYVTRDEFKPVQRVVYALVSVTLLTVVAAILAMVVVK